MPDWQSLFAAGAKPLIGMVHLQALPGSPGHDHAQGIGGVIDAARQDVAVLEAAGFDGVLFVNEADAPFPAQAPLESATALAAVVASAAPTRLPFGVEFLFDPLASLACATATGAAFIRGGLVGAWETTSGRRDGRAAEVLRARSAARAEHVGLFSVPVAEFAFPLGSIDLFRRISTASAEGAWDVLLLGGAAPGVSVDRDTVERARQSLRHPAPIMANSGVKSTNVSDMLAVFDGCFVGSDLKVKANLQNPIDPHRAEAFIAAARRAG